MGVKINLHRHLIVYNSVCSQCTETLMISHPRPGVTTGVKSRWPVVYKILLGHSHTHFISISFMYGPWVLSGYNGRVEYLWQWPHDLQSLKYLLCSLFKKFANSCAKLSYQQWQKSFYCLVFKKLFWQSKESKAICEYLILNTFYARSPTPE